MKTFLLFFFFLTTSLQAEMRLTPAEAVKLGLENNYDILIARNEAEIARKNRGKGTAGFLPTLDATGSYSLSTNDVETNSPFSFGKSDTKAGSAQVSLGWTLFDGFGIWADNRRYDELAKLGEAQARSLIEGTVVSILNAYFDLVQQEMLLDVADSALTISKTRLDKERTRRELGGASSTDLLNAQVSYNNDRAVLLNQELNVDIARKELNILLGREPFSVLSVVKEIEVPPLDIGLEEILTLAEERNSELRVARRSRRVAAQGVTLARSSFFPRLSLLADYGYSDVTISSDSPSFPEDINTLTKEGFLGLTLSYNLFNGGRDRIDLQNAKIERTNSELAYRDALNRLQGLVKETYETYRKRVELVELEEQNVLAAEQNLALNADRYRIGAATSLEFRDAQVNLIRAHSLLIAARFQARIAKLEIERLTGNISID